MNVWVPFSLTAAAFAIAAWRFFGVWWNNPHMTQMQVFQANILWLVPILMLTVTSQWLLNRLK